MRNRGQGVARLAAGALVAGGLIGVAPAGHASGTVATCADASLRAAVAAGGTVTFGVDCNDLVLSSEIVIPAGRVVDIEANGHSVTLDGNGATRLFRVTGGRLTIGGLLLQGGTVRGAN